MVERASLPRPMSLGSGVHTPISCTLRDVHNPKFLFGQQSVVRGAEQAKIVRRVLPTTCPGLLVVELKKRARRATAAVGADEGAALVIARDDLTNNRIGNVFSSASSSARVTLGNARFVWRAMRHRKLQPTLRASTR